MVGPEQKGGGRPEKSRKGGGVFYECVSKKNMSVVLVEETGIPTQGHQRSVGMGSVSGEGVETLNRSVRVF